MDEAILRAADVLKYEPLKEEQRKAIAGFLSGQDVFVVLPTGYGKTVCYSCLPLAYDIFHATEGSIIVIISPLLALISDQLTVLSNRSISAASVTSDTDPDSLKKIIDGKYSLVFISPELFVGKCRRILETKVYQEKLIGIVVDEAHCVLKW